MVSVKIPKPDPSGAPVVGLGKVFVLFDNKESAAKTRDALHGRLFDNRTVDCAYMPEGKFLTGDLRPTESMCKYKIAIRDCKHHAGLSAPLHKKHTA